MAPPGAGLGRLETGLGPGAATDGGATRMCDRIDARQMQTVGGAPGHRHRMRRPAGWSCPGGVPVRRSPALSLLAETCTRLEQGRKAQPCPGGKPQCCWAYWPAPGRLWPPQGRRHRTCSRLKRPPPASAPPLAAAPSLPAPPCRRRAAAAARAPRTRPSSACLQSWTEIATTRSLWKRRRRMPRLRAWTGRLRAGPRSARRRRVLPRSTARTQARRCLARSCTPTCARCCRWVLRRGVAASLD